MAGETMSLGEFLRYEREKRGITIEQVASATKISVRLLYSLEADQYVDLPAKPFIRGFVTSYVRFIGQDPQEVLTRFGDFIDSRALDRPARDAGHSGYAFEKREGEQSRTILWMIMGSFILLGGLVILVFKPSLKHSRHGHVEKLRDANPLASASPIPEASGLPLVMQSGLPAGVMTPVVSASPVAIASSPPSAPDAALPSPSPAVGAPSPVPTAVPSPLVSASPLASPTVSTKPDPLNSGSNLNPEQIKHRVVFKALADVWVRYQVDNKPVMKFILRQDRVLVLRAQELVRFQVSEPGSITFSYNRGGSQIMDASKNIIRHLSTASLVFPVQATEKIKESFIGEGPLPTSVPSQ
jgi:cytoskeleton protein RodZ